MTAGPAARTARGLVGAGWELSALALEAVRRFPSRVHDRRFWQIQAMVVGATGPHYVIEAAGFTNPFETFHGLAITCPPEGGGSSTAGTIPRPRSIPSTCSRPIA